jgi:hypothetical protein
LEISVRLAFLDGYHLKQSALVADYKLNAKDMTFTKTVTQADDLKRLDVRFCLPVVEIYRREPRGLEEMHRT